MSRKGFTLKRIEMPVFHNQGDWVCHDHEDWTHLPASAGCQGTVNTADEGCSDCNISENSYLG